MNELRNLKIEVLRADKISNLRSSTEKIGQGNGADRGKKSELPSRGFGFLFRTRKAHPFLSIQ